MTQKVEEQEPETVTFADGAIHELKESPPTPFYLKLSYILCISWGIVWMWMFWSGSWGWLDRGSWQGLEKAANTTMVSEHPMAMDTHDTCGPYSSNGN